MHLLHGLNPQQRAAVTAPTGPVLVLAGPGSGKTRVLTHRLAYLVRELGASPESVVALTFTNKAAREMGGRVQALLSQGGPAESSAPRPSLGTFHAFAARLLRREAGRLPVSREFVIFDDTDQEELVRQALKELNLDPKQVQPGAVHAAISQAKNELQGPEQYPRSTYFAEITQRVYVRYQELLQLNNALDFDDLLLWPVRLFRQEPELLQSYRRRYPHLLVDEFQDTNTAQYTLLRLLGGEEPDLFVVGDPDQSIYRWRGADYRNVLRLQKDYPRLQTFLLEQNYRSTQTILDAAMAVIDRHPDRTRKRLFTERGRGQALLFHEAYDPDDEAAFVVDTIAGLVAAGEAEPGDCAVMYRTNAQSRALEEAFLKAGLPYRLVGAQRFYGRREIRDLMAYLRLIHNPSDQVSLLRALNTPPRGIGDKSVAAMLAAAASAGLSPGELLLAMGRGAAPAAADMLPGRARPALQSFGANLAGWIAAAGDLPLDRLIDQVILEAGFRPFLDDGTEEGADRWANVLELRGVAAESSAVGLVEFLEQVALVSDQDTLTESVNAPTLLTLHAAKGLEFPVVFILGLDEGELPHHRSLEDPEAMAEERRLFYVGLTRAENRVIVVRAFRRRVGGVFTVSDPSRFLDDLPADLVEGDLLGMGLRAQATYARQTRWESPAPRPSGPRFAMGMRVRHPSFGEGVVMETMLHSDDEEVTVEFERGGVKRLAASVAPLEILE
jgi:DNA helicase-2/ATP-dependent DNA helicase PcrA